MNLNSEYYAPNPDCTDENGKTWTQLDVYDEVNDEQITTPNYALSYTLKNMSDIVAMYEEEGFNYFINDSNAYSRLADTFTHKNYLDVGIGYNPEFRGDKIVATKDDNTYSKTPNPLRNGLIRYGGIVPTSTPITLSHGWGGVNNNVSNASYMHPIYNFNPKAIVLSVYLTICNKDTLDEIKNIQLKDYIDNYRDTHIIVGMGYDSYIGHINSEGTSNANYIVDVDNKTGSSVIGSTLPRRQLYRQSFNVWLSKDFNTNFSIPTEISSCVDYLGYFYTDYTHTSRYTLTVVATSDYANIGSNFSIGVSNNGYYIPTDGASIVKNHMWLGSVDYTGYQFSVPSEPNTTTYDIINGSAVMLQTKSDIRYATIVKYYTLEDVETFFNSTGCFWATNAKTAQYADTANPTDAELHLGIIDENGFSRGKGAKGEDIKNNPNFSWNTSLDNPFDATVEPPEPEPEQDNMNLGDFTSISNNSFNNYYLINKTNLKSFADFLNSTDDTQQQRLLESLALYGANPVGAISSLRYYPIDNFEVMGGLNFVDSIYLGRLGWSASSGNTAMQCNNTSRRFGCGSIWVYPKYNNFMDYAPFTKTFLYLPFVGTVEIDCNTVMGCNIDIDYTVDITTGTGLCVVSTTNNDGYTQIIKNEPCVIGIDISVTGTNDAQYSTAYVNSIINTATGGVSNVVGGAMSGGVGGAVMGGISALTGTLTTAFNLDQTRNETNLVTVGKCSPANSLNMPMSPFLIVSRPVYKVPDNFPSTIGYIVNKTLSLGTLSGYTVCNSPIVNIPNATETEKNMIANALSSGCYL